MSARRTMRACALTLAVALLLGAEPRGLAAQKPSYGEYVRAARALSEWRTAEAATLIADLEARAPDAPETLYLGAELAFVRGDYERAERLLGTLGKKPLRGLGEDLVPLIRSTRELTRTMVSRRSPKGRFIFFYEPGKDEAIVELAGEALDLAWERVGDDLGLRPSEPVRVELLGRAKDLARVSTLSEQAIETTGTIALCKYGKLMAVSPRGTILGYAWLDTLVHEYTHYVISTATEDRVPVWLHEGLARFEETRWRAEPGTTGLDRTGQHLLATALKKGRLVTFEEMHPSMALLPSAELAATAYAEVYTFVAWVHGKVGYAGLRDVLARIKDGKSERRALAEVLELRWESVESTWRKHLKTLPLRTSPQLAARGIKKVKLRKSDRDDTDNVGLEQIPEERARKLARLGGMLRVRGDLPAAAIEYAKALALLGPAGDPLLAGKLARTYLDLGKPDKAIATLTAQPDVDPDDAGAATTLGAAHLALGQLPEAEAALLRAVRIQPFDPVIRCGLAQIFEQTSRPELATRERNACSLVSQGQGAPRPPRPPPP